MRSLIDVFDSKSFGATFVGSVALVTVEGGIDNVQLLAISLLALTAYWWAFEVGRPDSGVDVVAADNPHANRLVVAAFAEHEREQISKRTKDALVAAKSRGIRLGRNGADRLAPRDREEAAERARQLAPILSELKGAGMSARQMAAQLIARGVATPNGGRWHAATVLRALDRAGL